MKQKNETPKFISRLQSGKCWDIYSDHLVSLV